MKKIRSFRCSECKANFERMVIDSITIVKCECGGISERQLSAPKHFGVMTKFNN